MLGSFKGLLMYKIRELLQLTNPNYIITHNDTDGVCAGAILLRKFKKAEIFIARAGRAHEILKHFRANNKRLVIVDISLNPSALKETVSILKRLKRKNWTIYWLDHHLWDDTSIESISKVVDKLVVDRRYVGGELAYLEFGKDDEVAKKLAEIARDADLFIRSMEITKKFVFAIKACHYKILKHMIHRLADGIFEDEKINKCWQKGLEIINKSIEYGKNKSKIFSTKNNRKYALLDLRGKHLSGNDAAHAAIETFNLDFAVVIYSNNRLSFYGKRGSNINLVPLAKSLGGGGHPTACGAKLELSLKSKVLSKLFGRFYTPNELKEALKVVEEVM
ncbi:MAG: DHH family phosphoesterase [Candidatus Asgardarchaeia archaeon]